jgi:oxygen-dependent protoporphyrinogen oxidase
MKKQTDILIVGAGITGLTAAYYLKKAGKDCLVVEEQDRIGGAIRTEREEGFIYESGPNTGVLGQPEVFALFEDLGATEQLEIASAEVKRRYILKKGKWEALPSGLKEAIRTPLFTLGDKFRILGEPLRKRGKNPEETLAELVKRRMGKSFLEYAVDPFILGVYAGDPNLLVPKYALPKLHRLEQDYGSFIRGSIKKRSQKKSEWEKKATREVFSCRNGLGTLVGILAEELGEDSILTSASGTRIQFGGDTYSATFLREGKKEEVRANRVILTSGAHKLPALLPDLKSETMADLTNVRQARVVEVALGFKRWEGFPPDGFGGLIPFKEKRDILGILFMSAFLKNRAPEGGALFTVFLGGIRRPEIADLDDAGITTLLEKEFTDLMGVDSFAPDLMRIMRYEHAIPQYEKSSGKRFEAVSSVENSYPRLYLRGNYIGGIGLADRIKQGRRVAEEIVN